MPPLTLVLPEPPTFNEMIDLAKKRTKITKHGTWMKQARPIVYDNAKHDYELLCLQAIREARITIPRTPWPTWTLDTAHFRVHQLRDPIELLSALKWPVDWLVSAGFVANDSPRELLDTPKPTQEIDRKTRSITLTISPISDL